MTTIAVRVTPKASRNEVKVPDDGGPLRIYVTVVPEDGKANKAVQKLLAKHLGVSAVDADSSERPDGPR